MFWNGHHINHASDWDKIFTQIRKFHGKESPCWIACDLVGLIPGSKGHNLLLRKQHEACVNGGKAGAKASNRTDDGMRPGEHAMDNGKIFMASEDRGRKGSIASNATDDGMQLGQHAMDDGKISIASEDRGRKGGIATPKLRNIKS